MNHPCNYQHPLFLLTDHDYNATGAVEMSDTGRFIGRDTAGRVIFDRKDYSGAVTAARNAAARCVSASWYGIPAGRPADHSDQARLNASRVAALRAVSS